MKRIVKNKFALTLVLSLLLAGFTEKDQKSEFFYYWYVYSWGHPSMAWSYYSYPTNWNDSDAAIYCMGDATPCAAKFASNFDDSPMDPGISFEEQDWW